MFPLGNMKNAQMSCRPAKMAEDEEIVYDFCMELLHSQSVSDPTYARAVEKFGEAGVVEAASLVGYYTYLSMIMNTACSACSPMPAGAKPALTPFPSSEGAWRSSMSGHTPARRRRSQFTPGPPRSRAWSHA
jgi:hypothetical protein